jgi:hypothetical protein
VDAQVQARSRRLRHDTSKGELMKRPYLGTAMAGMDPEILIALLQIQLKVK